MTTTPTASATERLLNSHTATERARVTSEDFLSILIKELRTQDPLEPLKSEDFLNQIASLNQLESYATLTDGIRALKSSTELANASSLIGRAVIGTTDDGLTGGGIVSRVIVNNGEVKLVIGDQTMSMSAVAQVFAPAPAEEATAS